MAEDKLGPSDPREPIVLSDDDWAVFKNDPEIRAFARQYKKEQEIADIEAFLEAYPRATGDELLMEEAGESPDAVCTQSGDRQTCKVILGGTTYNQGIEYLGFRYDCKNAYIRNKTIQNLYRKMTRAARRDANGLARRYANKNASALQKAFNREEFMKRFNRVEDFSEKQDNYRQWKFWTYANRAAKIFGEMGKPIRRQLRKMKEIAYHKIDSEVANAVLRRDNPKRHKPVLLTNASKA